MPVRTSTVVTTAMVFLTLAGVATVFGGSIVAVVAPPEADRETAPPAPTPRPGSAAAGPAAAHASADSGADRVAVPGTAQ